MDDLKQYYQRYEQLKLERSTFQQLWMQLADYHMAHRGRFLQGKENQPGKTYSRRSKQINSTSRVAARTLASGMMAGISSPARPWFKLQTPDDDLNNKHDVKNWLHQVQKTMYRVFGQSNIYNSLHTTYGELGVFGTASMGVFEDFDNVIRAQNYTAGSYAIAVDGADKTDTFYREYQLTVAAAASMFGLENLSYHARRLYEQGNKESRIDVMHVIETNLDHKPSSPLARDMKVSSIYFEKGQHGNYNAKFLRKSGFSEFPIMTPRWESEPGQAYSVDCPGMTCLGDAKSLQLIERRKYQAFDKMLNPNLQGPPDLVSKMNKASVGQNIATSDTSAALTPVYGNWRPDIDQAHAEIERLQRRIDVTFFTDLFMMLSMTDTPQMTATEVVEKKEEKLIMLGPVLERVHDELLNPIIDRTFNIMVRADILPPPPEELEGTKLEIEYVSLLAQAQRMATATGVERFAGFASNMATIWPEAIHKVNVSQLIDDYGESIGVDPKSTRSQEEVEQRAAIEQQQIQQAQQMEQMANMVNVAKTASETPTSEEGNLLNDLDQTVQQNG